MKKQIIVLWVILGVSIGCGILPATEATIPSGPAGNSDTVPTVELTDAGIALGENAQWPAYLPAEIPVLEGDIRIVFGGAGSKVRIFYEPLTQRQLERYLDQCENEGFQLEYIIYVQEGFPDRSEERLKLGEFDAIEITKGEYRLRLECGSDNATLDIYAEGFQEGEQPARPTAAPLQWPDDIAASAPQPELCEVQSIANLSMGGYQIACHYAGGDLHVEQYLQILNGLGFQEEERLVNDQDEVVWYVLTDGNTSVKLLPHSLSSTLTFQVVPINP